METCAVCLESNEDIFSRITTLSTEWIDGKMQRIIEKHLWWWYLKPPSQSNGLVRWICRKCWLEVSTFHSFYGKVEKAHKFYPPIESILKKINRKKQEANMKAEASKHKKQDKNIDKFIKENAVDTLSLKAEFCFSSDVCGTNEEPVSTISLNEEICNNVPYKQEVEDNDSNCNEIQNKEAEPIVRKIKIIKFQTKKRNKVSRSKKKVQKKPKRIDLKENSSCETVQFDNFFKESPHELECCICNMKLPDFRLLKAHYRNEHNTKGYAVCCGNKYFKRCLLYDHLKVHRDPNFFKCQLCSKTYATRRGFKRHLETHEIRERKYNCKECGKSYFKLHIFERHKLTHLPESEKHFNCSQCSKKFASDYLRRQHENFTHAKKYIKICDVCGKSFSHNYSFLRHMEEHAGIQPSMETCDICSAKLANKKGLKEHMKMRHLEENLQQKICPYCSRVSPNSNAHRKHIKYTHIMQRKHACHVCDKAFRRPLELKEHLCTHTGEALYTCPYCPRTFISHANMYKHRKIAHRKEWEESRLIKRSNNGGKSVSSEICSEVTAIQKSPERICSSNSGIC